MESSERQFHLGLDTRDLGHSEPIGLLEGVPDERRLADPGLTTYDQDRALAPANSFKQPVQHIALSGPAQKCRRALEGHVVSLIPSAPWQACEPHATRHRPQTPDPGS